MGADGGLVFIPLKKPTSENYVRALYLLKPFWQFLTYDDVSNFAKDAYFKYQSENDCSGCIFGCYGTDRGDNAELGELELICSPFIDDFHGDLYSLTFDELDLECRTSPFTPFASDYSEHPLRRLWAQHFDVFSREDFQSFLSPICNVIIYDWAKELSSLLYLNNYFRIETWT